MQNEFPCDQLKVSVLEHIHDEHEHFLVVPTSRKRVFFIMIVFVPAPKHLALTIFLLLGVKHDLRNVLSQQWHGLLVILSPLPHPLCHTVLDLVLLLMLEIILVLPPIDQVIVEGIYRPEIRQEYLLASLQDFYQSLVDIIRLPPM